MIRWWLCPWLGVLLLLWVSPLSAQGTPRPSLRSDVRSAEVGVPFTVTLTVRTESGAGAPSGPTLAVPPGVTLRGPSLSSQQQVTVSGNRITRSVGLSASWSVTASRPGRVTLGPATVLVDGVTARSDAITVEIVPAGQGSPRGGRPRSRDPFDFFDPFSTPFPSLPGFGPGAAPEPPALVEEESPYYPDEFRLERPLDREAFLRSVARPVRVVLGEQVTFTTLAYARRSRISGVGKEPSYPDFLAYPIIETPQDQATYRIRVGDEVWMAVKVRELALFPVRTGKLTIEPMSMVFTGHGIRRSLERTGQPLEILVEEPPEAGRPAGYTLGDVGRFTLEARIEPRTVQVGEAVSVVVTIRGTGNFPVGVRVPQQTGVEWLPPTTSEGIAMTDGRPSGWRRLSHVVRLQRPGKIDLGTVTLPHWDPRRRAYAVAKVALGSIQVSGTAAVRDAGAAEDGLANLLVLRRTLGEAARPPPVAWGDRPWFWAALGIGPLAVVGLGVGVRAAVALRRRWLKREPSVRALVRSELGLARRAAETGDLGAAASACERAVHHALTAKLGVGSRGLLRAELTERLRAAGLATAFEARLDGLLDDLDASRFTGAGGAATGDLRARTERLTTELLAPSVRSRGVGG